jgi:hypothetical protein
LDTKVIITIKVINLRNINYRVRVLPFKIIKTQAGMKLGQKKNNLGNNMGMETDLLTFLIQLYHVEH